MNKEGILAMKSGRDLDKLVGETIFGYKIEERDGFYDYHRSFTEMQNNPYGRAGASRSKALCILTDDRPLTKDELDEYKRDMANPLLKLRFIPEQAECWVELPEYSTDISDAWQVVDFFTTGEYIFALVWCVNHWAISIDKADSDGHSVQCLARVDATNQAPEAICKAALLAKLEEENEQNENRMG